MKNYNLFGVGNVIELGKGGLRIDAANNSDVSAKNSNDELVNFVGANPTTLNHLTTKEYVDNSLANPSVTIFNVVNGISNLVLANITEVTKIEIEYAFALDSVDKIQIGRMTFLYDGIEVLLTSNEVEDSGNLGTINEVTLSIYENGNDFGITFDNQAGESFDFQYTVVNKFNVSYTPNQPKILASNDFASNNALIVTASNERYGQTILMTETGNLTNINFGISKRIFNSATISGLISLKVYDAPNGNLIGSSDLMDASTLPTNNAAVGQTDRFDFPFSTNIPLLAQSYYVEVDITQSVNPVFTLQYFNTTGNLYPDGEIYVSFGSPTVSPSFADSDLIFIIDAI